MAKTQTIKSRFGEITLLDDNPRKISASAFKNLCKSIERDKEFMTLRPIVVDAENVVIGGNQRTKACIKLGFDSIPDAWIVKADSLTEEQRKRFILIDNSPDGVAGEWDFAKLQESFSDSLLDCGFVMPEIQPDGDMLEEKDVSEDSPKLKAFIEARHKSRAAGDFKADCNFWACLVFETHAQKLEFFDHYKDIENRFNMYFDGVQLAKKLGVKLTETGMKPSKAQIEKRLSGLILDAKRKGD